MIMRALALFAVVSLSGCYMTELEVASHLFKRASGPSECSKARGHLKVGNPYVIKGVKYYPMKSSYGYREEGIASWYGADFHEKLTANGECYDMYALTAAHKTLPLPTTVRVTNMENGRSIIVRINDRGPYAKGRVIDLSYAVAKQLGMAEQGVAPVRVEAIGGPHHKPGGANTRLVKKSLEDSKLAALQGKPRQAAPVIKRKPGLTDRVVQASTEVKPAESTEGSFTKRAVKAAEQATKGDTQAAMQQAVPATVVEDLPPPPETIPETSEKVLTGGVRLYVQTGAFSSKGNALEQLGTLQKHAEKAFLVEVVKAGRTLHRVRSGPYASIAEADVMLAKLVDAGFNTAVIAIDR